MKKIVLFLLILGLGSGAFVYWRSSQSEPTDRIRISGNIELTQINIAFKTAGKLIDVAVTEGSHVDKGQAIARLDTEQLLRQKDNALATLAGAQSVLLQTQTALQYQTQALAADTDARTADISVADARLRELKSGARPQEVQEAKSVVEAAKSDYERAKKDWERAQSFLARS